MITIHKILNVKIDPNYNDGSQVAQFVLTDGITKKKSILGGLPDNNNEAKAAILARAQELFDKGKKWDDTNSNIENPKKDFLDNLPSLETALIAIDGIESLAEAKPILKKIVKCIYALKEQLDA